MKKLSELRAIAEAAKSESQRPLVGGTAYQGYMIFNETFSPSTVLEMIEALEKIKEALQPFADQDGCGCGFKIGGIHEHECWELEDIISAREVLAKYAKEEK